MRALPLLVLIAACSVQSSDREGTFVGNPGKMDVGVSGVDPDITLDLAEFEAESLNLEACDGTSASIPLAAFDALGGRDDAVEIPGGEFCRATLIPVEVDPLVIGGVTASGTTFTLVLDPGVLVMPEVFRVDETELVWDLPLDGLDPADIDALGDGAVIEAYDVVALEVATVLAETSGIYEDLDADGVSSESDPLLGAVDPMRDADPQYGGAYSASDAAGCSCDQSPSAAPWLFFPLILAIRRRRGR